MKRSRNGTAYELSGRKDLPIVTLIHGLGVKRELWHDHVEVLSRRYRVLIYDLYGHGQSTRPPDTLSLAVFSQQLRELLDELDIEHSVIAGFSLGGMINRRFAMDYPSRVSALIVLNSPHERKPDEQKLVEQRVSQTAQGGPAATIETSLERWFTEEFRSSRVDVVSEIRAWVLANDPVIYTQCRQVLARGVLELVHPESPITAPTLVMTCENDSGSTPEMARAIAAGIPGAQTVIVPQLQHLGLTEKPVLFLEPMLRFLDTIPGLS